ncbi:hypothetical protein NDU88_010075 [Pleurodeles waltl]|uniref:Uncharacterized protein n=1 Tax=Pleurodeles waltl TaxID=8319 RepID=A0AAV7QX26_PLEWA|nr:hypothetical protein NDU88_010075 [Pleurodeles waltl]
MKSQIHNKKEGSLNELFNKTPTMRLSPVEPQATEDGVLVDQGTQGDGEASLTRSFMEQLFGSLHEDFVTLKQEIAAELRVLDGDKAEYVILRTKQKFYAGGNKAGHLLARQVQAVGRRVAELQLPDGTRTCHEEHILHQLERFYSDLYTAEELGEEVVEGYLNSVPLTRIPPAASELIQAGKAPSADGFGAEFYMSFGAQLAPVLAQLYNTLSTASPLLPTNWAW